MKSIKIEKHDLPYDIYSLLSAYHKNYKGWIIAGGFARLIGHKVLGIEWGSKINLTKYFCNMSGDIDFFTDNYPKDENSILDNMNNVKDYINSCLNIKEKSKCLNNNILQNSVFSNNVLFKSKMTREDIKLNDVKFKRYVTVKNQFVKKFTYNSIEEMCESFDLINSKWFIDLTGKDIVLLFDEKTYELDLKQLIGINSIAKNPFFSTRISKYGKNRGLLKGICDESLGLFREFIYTNLVDDWDQNYTEILRGSPFTNLIDSNKFNKAVSKISLDSMSKANLLSLNDYSLFIGRWKVVVSDYENYDKESCNSNFVIGANTSSKGNMYNIITRTKQEDFALYHIRNFKELHEKHKSKSKMGF